MQIQLIDQIHANKQNLLFFDNFKKKQQQQIQNQDFF